MNRRILLATFCLLISVSAMAQYSMHTYAMGPLKWTDFDERTAVNGQFCTLEYYMTIKYTSDEIDGVSVTRPRAFAWIDYFQSWCDPAYRTPGVLRYNQCIFDLLEYYRRVLDNNLNSQNIYNHNQLLDQTMKRLGEDVQRIEIGTQLGSDTAAISQIEARIKHLLDSTSFKQHYSIEDAPVYFGFAIGGEFQSVGGKLHDHFSFGGGMYADFFCGYEWSKLNFGFSIGGAKCLNDAYNIKDINDDLLKGDPLSYINLYVSYGLYAYSNPKMNIIPFVGYGMKGFYYGGDADVTMGSSNGCWHAGVEYNYNFSNCASFLGTANDNYNGSHNIFSLSAKLFASYNNFTSISSTDPDISINSPKGFMINLQLGFSWNDRMAKLR
ncbi:MAG: hypothetical protein MJZ67_03230 [Bacteroidales bacterium]|nr:hypothetical protein [Bacteroidales bacterium]